MDSQQPPEVPTSFSQTTQAPTQPPAGSSQSTSSTTSIVALILGILSLTCCGFIAGIPAIFLGRSEMKACDEGRIHPSNKMIAKIAMILGIISTALTCLATILYAALFALGISMGALQDFPLK